MVSRADIVAEATRWADVRWRHLGRSRTGVDCVGLVVVVARALGLSDYDPAPYPRAPMGPQLLSLLRGAGLRDVPIDAARPGDVLAMHQTGRPCHVGIVGNDGYLIHAATQRRRVVVEPLGSAARAVGGLIPIGCFALPGLED